MSGVELVVLGSGGPEAVAGRASSGHLVLADGRPRVMVDAGGGVLARLADSGLDASDIDALLLTHLHPDHAGELAPLLWALYLCGRDRPLRIVGPAGRDGQPGTAALVGSVLGPGSVWGDQLRRFEPYGVEVEEVDSDLDAGVRAVMQPPGLEVLAAPVRHGPVPALAYRVGPVAFSGDVDRADPNVVALATGCGLLVHDFAVPGDGAEHRAFHATPSEVGTVARDAGCDRLVLAHLMRAVEDDLDRSVARVQDAFRGEVVVAEDLQRLAVG